MLIFSDKAYAEKADARSGGVGDETTIISAEVYGHATVQKFIPIVMERDDEGEAYLPAYLKTRMYRDFTGENFEEEYEKLLRTIYEAPLFRKPALGKRPSFLDDTPQEVIKIKQASLRLAARAANKQAIISDFLDNYIEAMKLFYKKQHTETTGDDGKIKFEFLEDLESLKEYRDIFLDVAKDLILTTDLAGNTLGDIFEKLYNSLNNVKTFEPDANSCTPSSLEIYKFHIWELFICVTALLLHYEKYNDIYQMLHRTYFLTKGSFGNTQTEDNYIGFYHYSSLIEEEIKPKTEFSNRYTLSGHLLCMQRQNNPILTQHSLATADLFLYQVFPALDLGDLGEYNYWFPQCYVYAADTSMWQKLTSRSFCEKIYPLFGVDNMDELKNRLSKCTFDREMRYNGGFTDPAPTILSFVKPDKIGIYP